MWESAKWGDDCGLNGTNGRWEALRVEHAHTHTPVTHSHTSAADAVECHLSSLQVRLVGALSYIPVTQQAYYEISNTFES